MHWTKCEYFLLPWEFPNNVTPYVDFTYEAVVQYDDTVVQYDRNLQMIANKI